MIFLAYFLTTLSSPKMKRDLLTVKQFSLTGMGLYKAMVRARCALVCLKAGEMPPVDTAAPSRFRLRSDPPSPGLNKPGTSSPNRAILSGREDRIGKGGYSFLESRARWCARCDSGGVARSWPVLVHHPFNSQKTPNSVFPNFKICQKHSRIFSPVCPIREARRFQVCSA